MSGTAHATSGFRGGLHEIFRQQAAEAPSRIAVAFAGETLTYQELDSLSDRLAFGLTTRGVQPGEVVGLCLSRGIDMVVAVLGVLKAGAAYLPVDPDYPAPRIDYIIEHSRAQFVVVAAELVGLFDRPGVTLVAYERGALPDSVAPDWAPVVVSPEAPAYVIYTSGTTGKPHGVVVQHGNVDRLFSGTQSWFGFSKDDVWTVFHSIAFDFSVWELWGALLHGGKAVVVPYVTTRTSERFYQLVVDQGVTVLSQTPTAFRAFDAVDARHHADLSLRHVVLGGEPVDRDVAAAWLARRGESAPQLVNMYGITETTVHVTYRPLSLELLDGSEHSPIGVPIPDLAIQLLDDAGQPVAHGAVGEIHVRGPGVALGYLHEAELTAARFTGSGADRVYRTGDLGVTYDGVEYFFVGRADAQIKLHGYRIDPREIEAVADAFPGLSNSVVSKVPGSGDDAHLMLFALYDPETGQAQRAAAADLVLANIRATLPAYMCPARCVLLDEYPRNHNGKIDHDSLQATYHAPDPSPQLEAVVGHAEKVKAIWEQVLGKPVAASDEDFFEAGGTSLDLIRIMQETKKQLAVEVDLGAFADGLSLDVYVDHVGEQFASRKRATAERGPS